MTTDIKGFAEQHNLKPVTLKDSSIRDRYNEKLMESGGSYSLKGEKLLMNIENYFKFKWGLICYENGVAYSGNTLALAFTYHLCNRIEDAWIKVDIVESLIGFNYGLVKGYRYLDDEEDKKMLSFPSLMLAINYLFDIDKPKKESERLVERIEERIGFHEGLLRHDNIFPDVIVLTDNLAYTTINLLMGREKRAMEILDRIEKRDSWKDTVYPSENAFRIFVSMLLDERERANDIIKGIEAIGFNEMGLLGKDSTILDNILASGAYFAVSEEFRESFPLPYALPQQS